MRRILIGLLVVSAVFPVFGCATVTRTADENTARYNRNLQLMMRQMGDDIDYALLADRQSRLSRFHTR